MLRQRRQAPLPASVRETRDLARRDRRPHPRNPPSAAFQASSTGVGMLRCTGRTAATRSVQTTTAAARQCLTITLPTQTQASAANASRRIFNFPVYANLLCETPPTCQARLRNPLRNLSSQGGFRNFLARARHGVSINLRNLRNSTPMLILRFFQFFFTRKIHMRVRIGWGSGFAGCAGSSISAALGLRKFRIV
jgi:hypothetical protein